MHPITWIYIYIYIYIYILNHSQLSLGKRTELICIPNIYIYIYIFFCIELWLEIRSGYSTITLRRKNTKRSIVAIDLNINITAEHSWFEDHALYLVRPKESCLLWAAETWFPLTIGIGYNWFIWACIGKKTAGIRAKIWVILLHDNVQPHVTKVIKKYLETLKWDVSSHLPYSPDIAPFDYWLFRRLQVTGSLLSQKSKILQNWIASKDESFFRDGIRKLPERWKK